jgi:hypothetical protein
MEQKFTRTFDDVEISLTEDEWELMTDQKLARMLGKDVSPPPPKPAKKATLKKKVS